MTRSWFVIKMKTIKRSVSFTMTILFLSRISYPQDLPLTPFELSEGSETSTYDEGIEFFSRLAIESANIHLMECGKTDSGLPLHLAVYNSGRLSGWKDLRESDKIKILIINAIHPGEPDGVDASMMILRDLATGKILNEISDRFILMVIPFYNIGGALNRNSHSRVNQNGPESYGFRGNSKNLDLNRDFLKMDSRNAASFARIFHDADPDILIDTHTTNGADYPYTLTYVETHPYRLGEELGTFVRDEFTPALAKSMQEKDMEIIPYVNVFGKVPDNGFEQFIDLPRYSTGYAALFQTIGYMAEAHMLKPFNERVRYTEGFIKSMIEQGVKFRKEIKEFREKDNQAWQVKKTYPLNWTIDDSEADTLDFKAYRAGYVTSGTTGNPVLHFDSNFTTILEIPYFNRLSVSSRIEIPEGYIVPQAWEEVIERLSINQVEWVRFERDTLLNLEVYYIAALNTVENPYEGHYFHENTVVSSRRENRGVRSGDYFIPARQPGIRYIVETLEPAGNDSFFNWNFFDTILSRKEYFSTYVFDREAGMILDKNPWLRDSLENMKRRDQQFRSSNQAQLEFIYLNSLHREKEHMRYPVYRLVR